MSTSTRGKKQALFPGGASTRGTVNASKRSQPMVSVVGSQSRVGRSTYGTSRSNVLSSASGKNVKISGGPEKGGQFKPPVQVTDESGQDVTPLPLLSQDAVKAKQSNLLTDGSGGTPTDLMSQASIYQTGTVTASTFGGGPFSRSVFSHSQASDRTESISDDIAEPSADISSAWAEIRHRREEVKEVLTEADLDKVVDINLSETEMIWLLDMPGIRISSDSDEAAEVRERNQRYQENAQQLAAASKAANQKAAGNLAGEEPAGKKAAPSLKPGSQKSGKSGTKASGSQKTSTPQKPSAASPMPQSPDADAPVKSPEGEILVKSKAGNDRYVERGMNTFNEPLKTKTIQTAKISHCDSGVNATTWDMFDTYKELDKTRKAEGEDGEGLASRPESAKPEEKTDQEKTVNGTATQTTQTASKGVGGTVDSSMAGTDSIFASKEANVSATVEDKSTTEAEILKSENLKNHLVIMERVVNLNSYQPKQASFRTLKIIQDIDKALDEKSAAAGQMNVAAMGPNLERLWSYACPLTKARNVSCVSWNKLNPDILAVGYGQFEFTSQKQGLVCCWSLKNPEFPERIYNTETGVTAMDFSRGNPNLLAVGLYDGTVAIYNVRTIRDDPILDSFESSGKHTSPVWQLRWIEKDRGSGEERAEVLVSISTDGRVTQWSIRKGFECNDLMRLKRVSRPGMGNARGNSKKGDALISRQAGGLCFDFSTKDSNIYLAGTEDGVIHKCSCSYNEQYLDSFFGHNGPVYKIQWSPFVPDVFLSCSGDWSIRLWHQDRPNQPVLTFFSSTKCVHDICWSPRSSTVFACVNEGAVEIWDLNQSTLDPIIVNTPVAGVKMSTVAFALNSECVLVGDTEGQVTVFQLRCMPQAPENQAEELTKIMQTSLASQLQAAMEEREKEMDHHAS